MFTDTHLHIADDQFSGDRDATIERAQAAGVSTLIEIAESPEMWDKAVALADRYSFIYAGLGIHPHHAHHAGPDRWPTLEKTLRSLLKHPKVVAIGEFGLDYFRMQNTRGEQQFLFREQLKLAKELDKPIIIHCRENNVVSPSQTSPETGEEAYSAHADIQAAFREFFPETSTNFACPRPSGVVHCFSGTWQDAQTYMSHGFMLGIDGPVTYPSAKLLQQNVLRMPLERLVLETDSPYLPPQIQRGKRNEPLNIPVIAEAVATLKRRSTSDVARQTTENARALFRLPGG